MLAIHRWLPGRAIVAVMDGVALFDRAVGRMFRRAEAREEEALMRDARAVNDKVRLLARLGTALIEARADGADLDGAVADSVGWDRLAASIAGANKGVRHRTGAGFTPTGRSMNVTRRLSADTRPTAP